MKKKNLVLLITLASIFVILATTLLIYYFGASYPHFNKVAHQEFLIPGLDTNFVPQGLAYSENTNDFFVCGYFSNGEPSRVYVVNKSDYTIKKYFTIEMDNTLTNSHFGGIAVYNNTVWVAGNKSVLRLSLQQISEVENTKSIVALDKFTPDNNCDFLTVINNQLIVGEFYHKKSYETLESHHIKTSDGTNKALSLAYDIDENNSYGLVDSIAEYGISTTDKVQGMTTNKDGNIVLSTSYAIFSSNLYTHTNILGSNDYIMTNINNQNLKVYVLDKSNLISKLTCPAMTEEIEFVDNKVFVCFESASKKYKLFNRTRTKYVYSLDI